jgi:galactokinase
VSEARDRARRAFASRFGELTSAREWWVPGRIELLGKHVDYGGGRSLLVAVERGIHVLARPRRDNLVHITDARSRLSFSGELRADLPATPGRWTNYPISVLRRLARDFPGATTGMDVVLSSSLPSAAGLSSSSAVIIATWLPLAAFNQVGDRPEAAAAFPYPGAIPGYLGAVENGLAFGTFPADFGVGTLGGSQDHTAIMACEAGKVSQFRFLPVGFEGSVALPADWCFAVMSSGVSAPKAGAVKARYNRLSSEMATIIATWNAAEGTAVPSLLDILAIPGAPARLDRLLTATGNGEALRRRLGQFAEETTEIIPAVRAAFAGGDAATLGAAVDRSQVLTDTVLDNQVDETRFLAARARADGAIAASAFGAGFGGSVWALVPRAGAGAFRDSWLAAYRAAFPARAEAALAFLTGAAPGAHEVGPAAGA